ncbi:hypothetical protein [uncultured Ellagibacter sp.]|uniref:hypothetical protein n=1 Tax=uncultured Ellagibacter sp. TaxID=2137580 RepID=UPI0026163494|nr:hypothetical protein [uncultured Ellagibacter sp.]
MQNLASPTMRRLTVFALCAFLALCLAGCATDEPVAQAQPQTLEIGENAGDVYSVALSNSSGKSVVSMSVKLPGDESFSANLMSSDAHLKDGEDAIVYVPKQATEDGTYVIDLKVVFGDGGVSVLHHLDLEEFSAATLLLNGKIGYVTYQGKSANRMISTLDLQTYYYNLEDPTAAARDKAEEEEEKRRLEKLEEDLKATEEQQAADATTSSDGTKTATEENAQTKVTTNDTQGMDIEDDPIEVNQDEDLSDD